MIPPPPRSTLFPYTTLFRSSRLGGTLQNDILKEYQAQKEFVFPPRPSMRLVRDTITFTAAEMPRWHSVSISGYHIRRSEEHTSELQSRLHLVCRLLLEKKKN